jgi:quercetin dioxygenase-like cupin family protein
MKFIHKIEQSKILELEKLLVPAEGQIFSTELAENSLFRLELYALGKGESISGHNLLETTLYLVTDGKMKINGKDLNTGDFKVVERTVCSEIEAVEDCQILFYTFFESEEAPFTMKHLPVGTPGTLADQVDFKENSVASKAIVQKKPLSLTLFSMDTGEGLNTHAAPGDAMVIPLMGNNHVEIDGEPFEIKQGDFIILPAHVPHSLKATDPFKMLLTVVKA